MTTTTTTNGTTAGRGKRDGGEWYRNAAKYIEFDTLDGMYFRFAEALVGLASDITSGWAHGHLCVKTFLWEYVTTGDQLRALAELADRIDVMEDAGADASTGRGMELYEGTGKGLQDVTEKKRVQSLKLEEN